MITGSRTTQRRMDSPCSFIDVKDGYCRSTFDEPKCSETIIGELSCEEVFDMALDMYETEHKDDSAWINIEEPMRKLHAHFGTAIASSNIKGDSDRFPNIYPPPQPYTFTTWH